MSASEVNCNLGLLNFIGVFFFGCCFLLFALISACLTSSCVFVSYGDLVWYINPCFCFGTPLALSPPYIGDLSIFLFLTKSSKTSLTNVTPLSSVLRLRNSLSAEPKLFNIAVGDIFL